MAALRLSLIAMSGSYSSLRCTRFSLQWLALLQTIDSGPTGFSSYSMQAQYLQPAGSRVQTQWLWYMGSIATWHVESSQITDRTCVPCIGRRISIHCTTREDPTVYFKY